MRIETEEEEALWVSCPACDALPGERCTGESILHEPMHENRIKMMHLLKRDTGDD